MNNRAVQIPTHEGGMIHGDLGAPGSAAGLVIFAHGSGSSRHSPRNRLVASVLQERGLATLLVDLLTSEEEARDAVSREHRFDITLLAERLMDAVAWAECEPELGALPGGFFGASTGAAAALVAAASRPETFAVVSRGGRPDLAGAHLFHVRAPTLLIVGEADEIVIDLNLDAMKRLGGPKKLLLIPGATHLFSEPGALEAAAQAAADWFAQNLAISPKPAP